MATIEISTAEEFVALLEGEYGYGTEESYLDVELTQDIDLNDISEGYNLPVPDLTKIWYINFNGNFCTIYNIYFSHIYDGGYCSIFYNYRGTVKNVTFQDAYLVGDRIYLFGCGENVPSGNKLQNVYFFGTARAQRTCRILTGEYIDRCGVSGIFGTVAGSNLETDYCLLIFGKQIMNCTAVASSGESDMRIFEVGSNATMNFIRVTRSANLLLWNGKISFTTAVVSNCTTVTAGDCDSCVYDKTVAEASGITELLGTGKIYPEPTEKIKDPEYMARTYGYTY